MAPEVVKYRRQIPQDVTNLVDVIGWVSSVGLLSEEKSRHGVGTGAMAMAWSVR